MLLKLFLVLSLLSQGACRTTSGGRSRLRASTDGDLDPSILAITASYVDPTVAGEMLGIIERQGNWHEVVAALQYFQFQLVSASQIDRFTAATQRVIDSGDTLALKELLRTIGFNCGGEVCLFDPDYINRALGPSDDRVLNSWVRLRTSREAPAFSIRAGTALKFSSASEHIYELTLFPAAQILLQQELSRSPKEAAALLLAFSRKDLVNAGALAMFNTYNPESLNIPAWLSQVMVASQSIGAIEISENRTGNLHLIPADWEPIVETYKDVWRIYDRLETNSNLDAAAGDALRKHCHDTQCGTAVDGTWRQFIEKVLVKGASSTNIKDLAVKVDSSAPPSRDYLVKWQKMLKTIVCGDNQADFYSQSCRQKTSYSATNAIAFISTKESNYLDEYGRPILPPYSPALELADTLEFRNLTSTIRTAVTTHGIGSSNNLESDPLLSFSPVLGEVYSASTLPLLSNFMRPNPFSSNADLLMIHALESAEQLRIILMNPTLSTAFESRLWSKLRDATSAGLDRNYYIMRPSDPHPIFTTLCTKSVHPMAMNSTETAKSYARIYYILPRLVHLAGPIVLSGQTMRDNFIALQLGIENFPKECIQDDSLNDTLRSMSRGIAQYLKDFTSTHNTGSGETNYLDGSFMDIVHRKNNVQKRNLK